MMKAVLVSCVMVGLGLLLLGGCRETDSGARFGGRVVSHVDAYGSGTGGEANLDGDQRSGGSKVCGTFLRGRNMATDE